MRLVTSCACYCLVILRKITAKTILSKSGITDYCLNPYVGCPHGCRYCYAEFMKKYTGHRETWGEFLDVKANAPELLAREIRTKKRGEVMISSVTDPYNPIERRLKLTRQCLEILLEYNWPIFIQTKSPLVLRDIDLISKFSNCSVGITITTDDDAVCKILEPHAPPISERMNALKELHAKGIRTFAFVGPILPMKDAAALAIKLGQYVDWIYLDKMNYQKKVVGLYRAKGWEKFLEDFYFREVTTKFRNATDRELRVLF